MVIASVHTSKQMFLLGEPVNLSAGTEKVQAGAYFNESNIVPSALVGTGLGLATRSAGWGLLGAAATPLVLNAVQGRRMYGGSLEGGESQEPDFLRGGKRAHKRKSRKTRKSKKSRSRKSARGGCDPWQGCGKGE